MNRFKNILFLADRENDMQVALERAVALARTNEARLTVMDVTPEVGLADYILETHGIDANRQLRDNRLEALEKLTQPYTREGIVIYTKVLTGITFMEVIRAVQQNHYDMVMKVAEHNAGLSVTLFGSTDLHLLRKCPCPVWIDQENAATGYKRVLAAVDPFDDESGNLQRLILDLATSLAAREQAVVDIVHTWQLPGESMLRSGRGRIPENELKLLLKEQKDRHRNGLNDLLAHYDLDSEMDNVHLVKGKPAQVIIDFATQQEADLIIMGTLGRVGIPGLIIGNTAEDVIQETRTAVLAVKPDGFLSPVV
jgi:nucleotide-binding universal stress UspA family protein